MFIFFFLHQRNQIQGVWIATRHGGHSCPGVPCRILVGRAWLGEVGVDATARQVDPAWMF